MLLSTLKSQIKSNICTKKQNPDDPSITAWLKEVKDTNIVYKAASDGRLDVLQYIQKNMPDTFADSLSFALDSAIGNKHSEVIIWLVEQGSIGTCKSFHIAVESGDMKIIEYLYEHKISGNDTAIDRAVKINRFDIVQLLYERKYRGSDCTIDFAAENGNLEMIIWLHEHKYRASSNAIAYASERGYLNIVKWLTEHDYPKYRVAVRCAAEYGHIDILEYLEECKFNGFDEASVYGRNRLNVLKWLHEHNYTISTMPIVEAVVDNRPEIFKWLYSNCYNGSTPDLITLIQMNKRDHMYKWIEEQVSKNKVSL